MENDSLNEFSDILISPSAVDTLAFTNAMAVAATGVNVVTSKGVAGQFGLTVSALSSVSAEPPLLLVCLNRRSPSVAGITQNGRFAVNILAEAQQEVARVFAGRPSEGEAYDFSRHEWAESASGLPILNGAAATFCCDIESIHDAGTHRIFIGRVIEVQRGTQKPLIYSNRHFGRMAEL